MSTEGHQGDLEKRDCHDCNAKPGEMHMHGCDTERCARCGGQSIGCDCTYEVCGIDVETMEETHPDIFTGGPTDEMYAKWDKEWGKRRMPWTGIWPGLEECREFGFWCVEDPVTRRFSSVPAGTPGATEHLNRLASECRWDPKTQRHVRNVRKS